jgi:hypothetical protein
MKKIWLSGQEKLHPFIGPYGAKIEVENFKNAGSPLTAFNIKIGRRNIQDNAEYTRDREEAVRKALKTGIKLKTVLTVTPMPHSSERNLEAEAGKVLNQRQGCEGGTSLACSRYLDAEYRRTAMH